jgi:hypothetical protein
LAVVAVVDSLHQVMAVVVAAVAAVCYIMELKHQKL